MSAWDGGAGLVTEWLSTREAAERTGYTRSHLLKLLVALEVPCARLTPRSHRRWHWPTIRALFHVEQARKSAQSGAS